jgi:hypothetical protein
MNIEKAYYDLTDSLSVLKDCVMYFKSGINHLYLPIAVELRKLICDGNNALIKKLYPQMLFHRLNGYYRIEEIEGKEKISYLDKINKNNFYFRGKIHVGNPERLIKDLFNSQKQDLELSGPQALDSFLMRIR